MNNKAKFADDYLGKIKIVCDAIDLEKVASIIEIIEKRIERGKTIFVVGNGGSAATASHIVCDLSKTILGKNLDSPLKRARVLCLTDNIPLLTALGNDCSYDEIFSQPLKNLGEKGDLLLVITGSGHSKNIIKAVETAKELRINTVGFLGMDGGKVKKMLDEFILVPSNEYGPIEDFHLIINHLTTAYLLGKRF